MSAYSITVVPTVAPFAAADRNDSTFTYRRFVRDTRSAGTRVDDRAYTVGGVRPGVSIPERRYKRSTAARYTSAMNSERSLDPGGRQGNPRGGRRAEGGDKTAPGLNAKPVALRRSVTCIVVPRRLSVPRHTIAQYAIFISVKHDERGRVRSSRAAEHSSPLPSFLVAARRIKFIFLQRKNKSDLLIPCVVYLSKHLGGGGHLISFIYTGWPRIALEHSFNRSRFYRRS